MDDDFDVNFSSSETSSDAKIISSSIESSSMNSAEATCNMIANSSEYISKSSRGNTAAIMNQNAAYFARMTRGMEASYGSLSSISQVVTGPLVGHMKDSQTFYKAMTIGMDNAVSILKEMNDRQKQMYDASKPAKQYGRSAKPGYEDVVDYSGSTDIKQYMKVIKNNTKKVLGPEFDMLFGNNMGGGGGSGNFAMMFAASPLQLLPTAIMSALIPATLDKAVKSFDTVLTLYFLI